MFQRDFPSRNIPPCFDGSILNLVIIATLSV